MANDGRHAGPARCSVGYPPCLVEGATDATVAPQPPRLAVSRQSASSDNSCKADVARLAGRIDRKRPIADVADPPPTGEGDHPKGGGGAQEVTAAPGWKRQAFRERSNGARLRRQGKPMVPLHQLRWSPSPFRGGSAKSAPHPVSAFPDKPGPSGLGERRNWPDADRPLSSVNSGSPTSA